MLISEIHNSKKILQHIVYKNYNNILDVGCGFGKYGILIRESLLTNTSESGDLQPKNSNIIIDAVESGEYFKKECPWLEYIYNHIYYKDIRDIKSICNNYQLLLMIDVIEHWTKEDFFKFKNTINVPILISTPKNVTFYVDKFFGFDIHITQWGPLDFIDMIECDLSTDESWIYILK